MQTNQKQHPANEHLIEIIEESGELEETLLDEVQEEFNFDKPEE